jgi:hypothetical protein
VAVPGPFRELALGLQQPGEVGRERGHDGVLHRHLDVLALAGPLPLEQSGQDGGSQMGARGEVSDRAPGLRRSLMTVAPSERSRCAQYGPA